MEKGPLVQVQIGPGQFVTMYENDAITQGMLAVKPNKNGKKMRRVSENKSASKNLEADQPKAESAPADDFTTIPGIGKGTARALIANGITTFAQLRQAGKLKYVTTATMAAIETWRHI